MLCHNKVNHLEHQYQYDKGIKNGHDSYPVILLVSIKISISIHVLYYLYSFNPSVLPIDSTGTVQLNLTFIFIFIMFIFIVKSYHSKYLDVFPSSILAYKTDYAASQA